jgi:hypothetical protein
VVSSAPDFLRRQRVGRILIGPDELAQDRAARGGGSTDLRTGFAISGPYVLTAWHCTGRKENASLWFRLRAADGSYCYVPVRVASRDEPLDVAVLAVDGTRLPDGELTETAARALLAQTAIPLATKVIPEQVRVWGFSGSKPAYDGDSYAVTLVQPDLLPSGVSVMKLWGPEFSGGLPALVRGLSGGPVLRAIDPDADDSPGEVAVGIVRGSVGPDPASRGGDVITTRLADVAHLPEIGAALRADVVRTRRVPAYAKEIEQLVPAGGLPDRGAELAELAAFARPGSARRPYAIWLGAFGSGKTALAAYFARNPPSGVDVVAFFVSRRLGNQTEEFWDCACDQLAALLGRSAVARGSRSQFATLWADAGREAAAAGRTLLLLVDGVEENDPHPSLIYPSIPRDGDASRRVVIFSGPSAVGAERDFALPAGQYARHELIKSRYAQIIEDGIDLTLETALNDTMTDALGVMAAAESPLSALDIAEVLRDSSLLGQRTSDAQALEPRIKRELEGAAQLGLVSPTLEDPDNYAFQDDLVRRRVVEKLRAATVAVHQGQLKDWGDQYEDDGWPERTPRYLLAGYPAMLDRTSDSARLLALTTSPARVERLRAITGSDTAAVDELALVLNHLAGVEPPEVELACRTALRREEMLRSMSWYPVSVIQAKAILGDWTAAHRLASHLERPELRAQALVIIGYTATADGKAQLGHELFVEALKAVSGITASHWRINAMWTVARTAVGAPWLIDPRTVADAFTDPLGDALAVYLALNAFAVCASTAGRVTDALAFLGEAYRIATAAKPAEAEPRPDDGAASGSWATVLKERMEQEPYRRAISIIREPAVMVARLAAESGDADTAVKVAALFPGLAERIGVLGEAQRILAAAGQRVEPVAAALVDLRPPVAAITDHAQRALAGTALAQAFAHCGLPADDLLNDARAAARHITQPGPRATALTSVARAAIGCGLPAHDLLAEARAVAANGMTDQAQRLSALAAIGFATAAAGEADAARASLAADIADPGWRAWAFAIAVPGAPAGGQSAGDLLSAARSAAAALADFAVRARTWNVIGQAACAAADLEAAVAVAAEIGDRDRHAEARAIIGATAANTAMTDPALRAQALAAIAQHITACGAPGDRVFAAAHAAAAGIIDPGRRGWALGAVVQAAVLARRYAAAAAATSGMTDPAQLVGTLINIAVAASAGRPAKDLSAGDPGADDPGADNALVDDLLSRARQVAASITNLAQRGANLGAVGQAALDARRYAAAEQTVAAMTDRAQRASASAAIALAAARAGAADDPAAGDVSADGLIAQARQITADVEDPGQRAWILGMLVQAAAASGDTSLARQLITDAEQDAMTADPIVRATVLGVLAGAASARPALADRLFAEACLATNVAGHLRRTRAVTDLSFLAAGRSTWPAYLAAEVRRAAVIADPFERAQALVALAQAASESGDVRLAAGIVTDIPDPEARIWTLIGLARSAAARGDQALAETLFSRACQDAGIPGNTAIDWAPLTIAQAAAAAGRGGLAKLAAQAIPWEQYRTAALTALDSVATIEGAEPGYFSPSVFDNGWLGVSVEAACAAGWFTVASQLAALVDDLNYRAQLLLTIAGTATAAGDSGRASAAARTVLGMKGKIDRPLLGRALATVVGGLADHDEHEACRELVSGLADCFIPDLFGIAARLAPGTIEVLAQELGVALPGGD